MLRRAYRRRLSHRAVWRRELPTEVAFWEEWIATKGLQWPWDYERRMNPDDPLREPLIADRLAELGQDVVRVLDVGAGPVTKLGRLHDGIRLEVTATDPLGAEYDRLWASAGVEPPVRTLAVAGEEIVDRFGRDAFDVAYARNALDHSADPAGIIARMVEVVRPGGFVALRHYRREAATMRYEELHQWNFEARGGHLVVWSPRAEHDLTAALDARAEVQAWEEGGSEHAPYVVATLRKRP
jgi:SAM-dependent methyltransferase